MCMCVCVWTGVGGYSAVKPLLHELIYKYSLMQALTIITTTKHIPFPNFHYLTVLPAENFGNTVNN